jgi:hypothetical protein
MLNSHCLAPVTLVSFMVSMAFNLPSAAEPLKASNALTLSVSTPPVPESAEAAQGLPVGFVKTVTGQAFIVTNGRPKPANIGSPVMVGSIIKTATNSTLGVAFKDSTLMSFGPETELRVEEYLYAPTEGKLRFGSNLVRGTLNYVSGVIAKLKPEGVTVNTPTGMIGVRGTHFAVKVEPAL